MVEMNFLYTSTTPRLEDYQKKFAEVLVLERKNGILQARMHTITGLSNGRLRLTICS